MYGLIHGCCGLAGGGFVGSEAGCRASVEKLRLRLSPTTEISLQEAIFAGPNRRPWDGCHLLSFGPVAGVVVFDFRGYVTGGDSRLELGQ